MSHRATDSSPLVIHLFAPVGQNRQGFVRCLQFTSRSTDDGFRPEYNRLLCFQRYADGRSVNDDAVPCRASTLAACKAVTAKIAQRDDSSDPKREGRDLDLSDL